MLNLNIWWVHQVPILLVSWQKKQVFPGPAGLVRKPGRLLDFTDRPSAEYGETSRQNRRDRPGPSCGAGKTRGAVAQERPLPESGRETVAR